MSRYEETTSDKGYICPYCNQEYYCDDWGFDHDGEEEHCEECGNFFIATANHSVTFCARPNCSVNKKEHDLMFHSITDNGKYNAYFCKTCNECVLKDKSNVIITTPKRGM